MISNPTIRDLKTPDLTYVPRDLTEAEQDLLTMLRTYLDDPETLFVVCDALIRYYREEFNL